MFTLCFRVYLTRLWFELIADAAYGALMTSLRPVRSTIRVPLFAARTLNATGQYRVTLSLW